MAKREKEDNNENEQQTTNNPVATESPKEIKAKNDLADALLAEAPARVEIPGENEVPASELGAPKEGLEGSEVNLTSFELMTVSGADAEQINTYLEKEAKRRFQKELTEISDAQYDKLLSDKVQFHKWMAMAWVDSYISARKEEARTTADGIIDRYGSNEDVLATRSYGETPETWKHTLAQPEASKVSSERGDLLKAKAELEKELKSKREKLSTLSSSLEEQHQAMIDQQRQQLESQGFDPDVIQGMMAGMEATFAKARADMVSQQEEALRTFKETGESELEARIAEFQAEIEKMVNKLRSGTKREMVLTADRWGRLLKKIAKENPHAINRDEQTGVISFDYNNSTREQDKIIFDHIDKELDRTIGANSKDTDSGLRKHNLEALFKTEAEMKIAEQYTYNLRQKINGGYHTPKDVHRHKLLFDHLRKQGFINPFAALTTEAELRPAYAKEKLSMPSALKEIKESFESGGGVNVRETINLLIKIVEQNEISWSEGSRRSHLSDYGVTFAQVVEEIAKKSREEGGLSANWYSLEQAIRSNNRDHLQRRLMPTLYGIKTEQNQVLSEVRGYYILPETLEKDFIGSEWTSTPALTEAAADQMRIHFKQWSKTEKGRVNARKVIWGLASKIKDVIKGNFDDTPYATSYGDAGGKKFLEKMKAAASSMQYRVETYSKQLEILEELAGEF